MNPNERMWNEIHRFFRYLKEAGVRPKDIDQAFESRYFTNCDNKDNIIYFETCKN